MPAIAYLGVRQEDRCVVLAIDDFRKPGRPLNRRIDIINHRAPFEWGSASQGAGQLAVALLADHLGDDAAALALHSSFKFAVIVSLKRNAWALLAEDLAAALSRLAA